MLPRSQIARCSPLQQKVDTLYLPFQSHNKDVQQDYRGLSICLHQFDVSPSLDSRSFRSTSTVKRMPKVRWLCAL